MERGLFRDFFFRLLGDQERRRYILENWHRNYPVTKEDTCLSDVFAGFIKTLLYGKVDLYIQQDAFSILSGQWSARPLMIRKEWLTPAERAFLHRAVKSGEALFMTRKEYENGLYSYENFVHNDGKDTKPYHCLVDRVWRRQLLRDFCFLLLAKQEGHWYLLDLLCAVQQVLITKEGGKDLFLAAIHGALQGRKPVAEIPCWNLAGWDYHSDVIRERDEEEERRSVRVAAAKASDTGCPKRKRPALAAIANVFGGSSKDNGAKRVRWEDQHDTDKGTLSSSSCFHLVRDFQNKKLMI